MKKTSHHQQQSNSASRSARQHWLSKRPYFYLMKAPKDSNPVRVLQKENEKDKKLALPHNPHQPNRDRWTRLWHRKSSPFPPLYIFRFPVLTALASLLSSHRLTRIDPSTANKPTRKIPIFGEVPVDGSLTVLAPAAAIAVLGFILSIVVAFNSKDEFVQIITQASQELADQASQKTNMVYDESVCRGLCSSQDQDLEGLKTFMESLTK
eukprot:scaffold1028_cov135-Cylindrotheca_fusiformis.AAC.20